VIARSILLGLLPVVAVIALIQPSRLSAIIGMGLFSFLLAAVYAVMHAPDVAITEATIGAALVTAIYILAIRRTGRLTVAADEAPGLVAREGRRIVGLEYEILEGFAKQQGLDLSIQFVPLRRIRWLVAHREADIGAGGLIAPSSGEENLLTTGSHLQTGVYRFSPTGMGQSTEEETPDYAGYFSELIEHGKHGTLESRIRSLDLARVLALTRCGVSVQGLERAEGEQGYSFLFSPDRAALFRSYQRYLESLHASGTLDEMVRRHFP
jgi:uncharacterized MnhB-related membrane protein